MVFSSPAGRGKFLFPLYQEIIKDMIDFVAKTNAKNSSMCYI